MYTRGKQLEIEIREIEPYEAMARKAIIVLRTLPVHCEYILFYKRNQQMRKSPCNVKDT